MVVLTSEVSNKLIPNYRQEDGYMSDKIVYEHKNYEGVPWRQLDDLEKRYRTAKKRKGREEKLNKLIAQNKVTKNLFPELKIQKPGQDYYSILFFFQLLLCLYIIFFFSAMEG